MNEPEKGFNDARDNLKIGEASLAYKELKDTLKKLSKIQKKAKNKSRKLKPVDQKNTWILVRHENKLKKLLYREEGMIQDIEKLRMKVRVEQRMKGIRSQRAGERGKRGRFSFLGVADEKDLGIDVTDSLLDMGMKEIEEENQEILWKVQEEELKKFEDEVIIKKVKKMKFREIKLDLQKLDKVKVRIQNFENIAKFREKREDNKKQRKDYKSFDHSMRDRYEKGKKMKQPRGRSITKKKFRGGNISQIRPRYKSSGKKRSFEIRKPNGVTKESQIIPKKRQIKLKNKPSIRLNKMLRGNIGDLVAKNNARNSNSKDVSKNYSKSSMYKNILENVNKQEKERLPSGNRKYGDVYISSREDIKRKIQDNRNRDSKSMSIGNNGGNRLTNGLGKSQVFKEDELKSRKKSRRFASGKKKSPKSHPEVESFTKNSRNQNKKKIFEKNVQSGKSKKRRRNENLSINNLEAEEDSKKNYKKSSTKANTESHNDESNKEEESMIAQAMDLKNMKDKIRQKQREEEYKKILEREELFSLNKKKSQVLIKLAAEGLGGAEEDQANEKIPSKKPFADKEKVRRLSSLYSSNGKPSNRTESTNFTGFKSRFGKSELEKNLMNKNEEVTIEGENDPSKQGGESVSDKRGLDAISNFSKKTQNSEKEKENTRYQSERERVKKNNTSNGKSKDSTFENIDDIQGSIDLALEQIKLKSKAKEDDIEPVIRKRGRSGTVKPISPSSNLQVINEEESEAVRSSKILQSKTSLDKIKRKKSGRGKRKYSNQGRSVRKSSKRSRKASASRRKRNVSRGKIKKSSRTRQKIKKVEVESKNIEEKKSVARQKRFSKSSIELKLKNEAINKAIKESSKKAEDDKTPPKKKKDEQSDYFIAVTDKNNSLTALNGYENLKKSNFEKILNSNSERDSASERSETPPRKVIRIYEDENDFKKINNGSKNQQANKPSGFKEDPEEKQEGVGAVETPSNPKPAKNPSKNKPSIKSISASSELSISSCDNKTQNYKFPQSQRRKNVGHKIQERGMRRESILDFSNTSGTTHRSSPRVSLSIKAYEVKNKKSIFSRKPNISVTSEKIQKKIITNRYEKDLHCELIELRNKGSKLSLAQSIDSLGLYQDPITFNSHQSCDSSSSEDSDSSLSAKLKQVKRKRNSPNLQIDLDSDPTVKPEANNTPKDILENSGVFPKNESSPKKYGLKRKISDAENTYNFRRRAFLVPGGKKSLIPGLSKAQLKSLRDFHEINLNKRKQNGDLIGQRVVKIGEGLYDFLFVDAEENEDDLDEIILGKKSEDKFISDYDFDDLKSIIGFKTYSFGQEIKAIQYLYLTFDGNKRYGNILGSLKNTIKDKIKEEEFEWDKSDRIIEYFASFSTGLVHLRFMTLRGESFSVGENVYEPTRMNYIIDLKRRKGWKGGVKVDSNNIISAILFLLDEDGKDNLEND